MADGPALALQKAVVAALRANPAVAALVAARVFDEPPQNAAFPFIRIGHIDVHPDRDSCGKGWSVTMSIEAHSRPDAGRVEATRVAEAIIYALDEQETAVPVAGFTLDWLFWLTQSVARESDGESYAAVVAFQASLS